MANFHKLYRETQRLLGESCDGLEAAEKHLTAMAIMARENKLHEWNSNGTVKTIQELRTLIQKLRGELP